jgi:hypothetical protein
MVILSSNSDVYGTKTLFSLSGKDEGGNIEVDYSLTVSQLWAT